MILLDSYLDRFLAREKLALLAALRHMPGRYTVSILESAEFDIALIPKSTPREHYSAESNGQLPGHAQSTVSIDMASDHQAWLGDPL